MGIFPVDLIFTSSAYMGDTAKNNKKKKPMCFIIRMNQACGIEQVHFSLCVCIYEKILANIPQVMRGIREKCIVAILYYNGKEGFVW